MEFVLHYFCRHQIVCLFVFFPFICKYVNLSVVGEGCTLQTTTAEEVCYSFGCGCPDGRSGVVTVRLMTDRARLGRKMRLKESLSQRTPWIEHADRHHFPWESRRED